ncbi:sensor histidine kinase [Terrimonas alba]|uniref:sensor histidine kinase n=1 Tax=Terrimonas alba TaxID=3349636 RepID=UPI0035F4CCD7
MSTLFTRSRAKLWPLLVHASAWILYGSFIHIANYITNPHIKITNTIFYLLPLCLTFYLSLYCLTLNKRKGVAWGIASFFIVFIAMALLGYCYLYVLLPLFGVVLYSSEHFMDFVKYAVLGYVQHFSYALLYFYVVQTFNKERELRRLQEEKLRNELENARLKEQELRSQQDKLLLEYAFMRAQVNPHFLHNTLNLLFVQAMEYSQELAENISKLSRMMHYSMESVEYETDKVPVKKELDNLHLLIDINKMRFDDKTVQLNIDGDTDGLMLPPLSMITIVENAFKYGDLKDPQHPLLIKVLLRYRQVYFYCRNKKRKNKPMRSSGNIGISNLSKRLDVAFKDKYEMNVHDEKDFYTFELTINN